MAMKQHIRTDKQPVSGKSLTELLTEPESSDDAIPGDITTLWQRLDIILHQLRSLTMLPLSRSHVPDQRYRSKRSNRILHDQRHGVLPFTAQRQPLSMGNYPHTIGQTSFHSVGSPQTVQQHQQLQQQQVHQQQQQQQLQQQQQQQQLQHQQQLQQRSVSPIVAGAASHTNQVAGVQPLLDQGIPSHAVQQKPNPDASNPFPHTTRSPRRKSSQPRRRLGPPRESPLKDIRDVAPAQQVEQLMEAILSKPTLQERFADQINCLASTVHDSSSEAVAVEGAAGAQAEHADPCADSVVSGLLDWISNEPTFANFDVKELDFGSADRIRAQNQCTDSVAVTSAALPHTMAVDSLQERATSSVVTLPSSSQTTLASSALDLCPATPQTAAEFSMSNFTPPHPLSLLSSSPSTTEFKNSLQNNGCLAGNFSLPAMLSAAGLSSNSQAATGGVGSSVMNLPISAEKSPAHRSPARQLTFEPLTLSSEEVNPTNPSPVSVHSESSLPCSVVNLTHLPGQAGTPAMQAPRISDLLAENGLGGTSKLSVSQPSSRASSPGTVRVSSLVCCKHCGLLGEPDPQTKLCNSCLQAKISGAISDRKRTADEHADGKPAKRKKKKKKPKTMDSLESFPSGVDVDNFLSQLHYD